MTKTNFSLILILSLVVLAGCSGRLFTVHKIDVQQGNAIDPVKVEKLEIGMNKEQVKFLMGSPLVTDVFHPDRWDYVYHLIPDYGDTERYHLTVFFEGGTVTNIEKNEIPEIPPEEPAQKDTEEKKES